MDDELLSSGEAARRLGISRATLYDWLADSDARRLLIRGQAVTIDYLQGGRRGQGRIRIAAQEVERLKELMRVHPRATLSRRPIVRPQNYPGISVKLGRPGF
jgi:hypothetical protein